MACCRDVNTSATYCNLPLPGEPLKDSTYLHGLAVKWAKRAVEKELPHPTDPAKPPLWQSVFSYALLKSLGTAFDDDGHVTSLSLKNTVKALVTTLLPPDDNRPPQFFMDDDLRSYSNRERRWQPRHCGTGRASGARSGRPAAWNGRSSRGRARRPTSTGCEALYLCAVQSSPEQPAIPAPMPAGWSRSTSPCPRCHRLRSAGRRNACQAQSSDGDPRGRDVQGISQTEPLRVPRPGRAGKAGIRAGGGRQCRTLKRSCGCGSNRRRRSPRFR